LSTLNGDLTAVRSVHESKISLRELLAKFYMRRSKQRRSPTEGT
jgi:hypothetical protein